MGLLTLPFRLPMLPVKGVIKLAEVIDDEVGRQYYDTTAVRREIEEADQAAASGEIPAAEASQRQQEAVSRLTTPRSPEASPAGDGEED